MYSYIGSYKIPLCPDCLENINMYLKKTCEYVWTFLSRDNSLDLVFNMSQIGWVTIVFTESLFGQSVSMIWDSHPIVETSWIWLRNRHYYPNPNPNPCQNMHLNPNPNPNPLWLPWDNIPWSLGLNMHQILWGETK